MNKKVQTEFNEITLTNDAPHVNATAEECQSVSVTVEVAERTDNIAETADSIAHTSGKVSKIASKTIALAGVITVAAVAVVAATDVTEVVPVAPSAIISDITVTEFIDDSKLAISFNFTDTDEIEQYTVWIEDSYGLISECLVENEDDVYTVSTTLADGTDIENGVYLVLYAYTYDGWEGEILREHVTLPSVPTGIITDINVSAFADGTDLTIDYVIAYPEKLVDYTMWIEDSNGVISECTIEYTDDMYVANATLTEGTDTANGLYIVVNATMADGWQGEMIREELILPDAPSFEAQYVGIESAYSATEGVGDVDIYIDYGTDYPDTIDENIYGFEVYLQDEDGRLYECEFVYSSTGYMQVQATLPTETEPAFDVYGRLTVIIKAFSYTGWEGTVYSGKEVIATEGYLKVADIYDLSIEVYTTHDTTADEDVIYMYVYVQTYDPSEVWSDLWITISDANGTVFTEQLVYGNGNIGCEDWLDEVENFAGYNFNITYLPETLTFMSDSYLYVSITATWSVPPGDSAETEVYGYYVYVTTS